MNQVIKQEKGGIQYIRLSDLPQAQKESFQKFIYGSQVPVIHGEGDVAYYWDYITWRKSVK